MAESCVNWGNVNVKSGKDYERHIDLNCGGLNYCGLDYDSLNYD